MTLAIKDWSRHSRRSEPMSVSANAFCYGDLAAVTTSSIPRISSVRRTRVVIDPVSVPNKESRSPRTPISEGTGEDTDLVAEREGLRRELTLVRKNDLAAPKLARIKLHTPRTFPAQDATAH